MIKDTGIVRIISRIGTTPNFEEYTDQLPLQHWTAYIFVYLERYIRAAEKELNVAHEIVHKSLGSMQAT